MVHDRGTDLSAERRTGKDGDEMVDQHLEMIRDVTPSSDGCEDCLRIGSRWVHLRLCLTCGHVGCCDSSPHRHARMHFHESGHPIISIIRARRRLALVLCARSGGLMGVSARFVIFCTAI